MAHRLYPNDSREIREEGAMLISLNYPKASRNLHFEVERARTTIVTTSSFEKLDTILPFYGSYRTRGSFKSDFAVPLDYGRSSSI